MNVTTGWLFFSAVIVSGKEVWAALSSDGVFASVSIRSLLGPGWRISFDRSAIVGLESLTSGRSAARNGLKYLALALAAADTSCLLLSVRPSYCSAKPWMTFWRPRRVGAFSVSNSWSRSTMLVVRSAGSVAPADSAGLLLGPGVIET